MLLNISCMKVKVSFTTEDWPRGPCARAGIGHVNTPTYAYF